MNDQLPLFDEPAGRKGQRQQATAKVLRDDAIAKVLENAGEEWRARARLLLSEFCREREEFIAEDFRVWALAHGLGRPHHHNAFGGIFSKAAKAGTCVMTERRRHMRTLKSHARLSPIWRSLVYVVSVAA